MYASSYRITKILVSEEKHLDLGRRESTSSMSELEADLNELDLNGTDEMEPPTIVKPITRQGR